MKQHTFSILLLLGMLLPGLFTACTDDMSGNQSSTVTVDDSNLVESKLLLNVAAMNTDAVTSRADDDDKLSDNITETDRVGSEAERKIDNIWVFQFAATDGHRLLVTPHYYDISNQNIIPSETEGKEVNVLLKPNVESIVYIVANTGSATWATVTNSATLEDVKKLTLPDPKYIYVNIGETVTDLSLPMEGSTTENVIPGNGSTIEVMITRMYAKVEISIGDSPESIVFTDVNVSQIPYYCQVGTLNSGNPNQAAKYPIGHNDWNSYAFKPGSKNEDGTYTGKKMVIYLPENLQGRTDTNENNPELKTEKAPNENALRVDFVANYIDIFTGKEKERGRHYAVYPGANNYNDYNIKRNFIYRVKINLYTDIYEQDIPSSNCFVVKPGQMLSFLPYYRTEEGGGHKFTDYLDSSGTDVTKMINDSDEPLKNIKIIWQTKDAIGDNSKGDLVWIDRRNEVTAKGDNPAEFYRKIHVKTEKKGNALIAAYNSAGNIVWSWHIWVTENDPASVSSAVVYSSYAWNENGIFTNVRVPGYAIMPCNLGALAYEPEEGELLHNDGAYQYKVASETHGMLYQWGRKDPFPPSIDVTDGSSIDYDDKATGNHYGNNNEELVTKTAGTNEQYVFHSVLMENIKDQEIAFSIEHPTVFICGTKEANKDEDYVKNNPANYVARGDWQYVHDETLWGGLDPVMGGSMKYFRLEGMKDHAGNAVHIFDNYGDKKSIYDPCPSGWRVPPGDLWLGFTKTGMNPSTDNYGIINTSTPEGKSKAGMYMYMNGWQTGKTIFFPTQGTRVADGRIIRSASCGNYHNATTDATGDNGSQRVNILHIHNNAGLFRVFETTYYMYYVKSTGGPIRCVRDHK